MRRIGSSLLYICILLSAFRTEGKVAEWANLNASGQTGLIDCHSANTLGFTKLVVLVSGSFTYDPYLVPSIERYGIFDTSTFEPFSVLYTLNPAIAFGITDFLDISLLQPFHFDILENNSPEGGAGDLKLSLKCRVPGTGPRILDGALLSQVTFGNGHRSKGFFPRKGYYLPAVDENEETVAPAGTVSFFTARKPTWTWSLLGTLGKRKFFFHTNVGICLTFDKELDNALCAAAGFEFHPAEWITLFTDVYAEPCWGNLSNGTGLANDPFHVSPGITFRSPGGAVLSIGGSWKLSSNREFEYMYRTGDKKVAIRPEPLWQLHVQVGWNGAFIPRDNDKDEVLNKYDKCPDEPEDLDNFEDQDGCPDPDNDNDGIPDLKDSCDTIPEDKDGFQDEDGCPDFDNDDDLVPDSIDQCPEIAEDRDGFADEDGCPDYDNDDDGVPDSTDKCMGSSEDRDGFEDGDGCPDLDNDNDAIPDSIDQCPDSAGTVEAHGCTEVKEKAKKITYGRLILSGVTFEGGTAKLAAGSEKDLDRVYQSLVDWPEVTIELQVHTDNSASPEASLMVSQRRADVLREYLLNKGISPSRLTATGKGSAEPIADNSSIKGRRLNNRVEIHRNDGR